jgi:hypothetical protein
VRAKKTKIEKEAKGEAKMYGRSRTADGTTANSQVATPDNLQK